ncbi:MAG: PC4/YdbC family ssDNA-binding protein [Treponemataceae bacterium]|nr:PC4/YdbC family ssDNA-binding protein [Treponemataceae bacterium]
MADDFSFDIKEKLGVIGQNKSGWTTELNLVSWGGRDPKFDIRSWSPDHSKMGKGVTLTKEELLSLKELLDKSDI